MRKYIISISGLVLLALSIMAARYMANSKKDIPKVNNVNEVSVYVTEVKNSSIPVKILASGQVEARNKIEVFAEVQGIMESGMQAFLEGNYFKEGDLLLKINSEEFESSLKAQKSSFFNQLVGMMPDLSLDFPASAERWNQYIRQFSMDKAVKDLPVPTTEQEKYYLATKGILTSYYNIKNLEVRLAKHKIRAPFSGYVTDVMVKPGTLIRPGQKLGEFVSQHVFELKVPVNAGDEKFLSIGKKVRVHNIERSKSWTGKVIRINKKLNTTTQSIVAVIELNDPGLRDGMFLEAELEAKVLENVVEVSRKLLQADNKIFVIQDSTLSGIQVDPVYFNSDGTALVRNIPDGSKLLSQPVPGAHEGMKVSILEN